MEVSKFITMSTNEYIDFIVSRSNQELSFKVKPNMVSTEDNFFLKVFSLK